MKRYHKVSVACNTCRSRKLKCDGTRPACGRCQKKPSLRQSCTYSARACTNVSRSVRLAPGPAGPPQTLGPPGGTTNPSSCTTLAGSDEHIAGHEVLTDRTAHADSGPGRLGEFASKLKEAIDTRLGLPSPHKHCPVPMIDAPLFGTPSLPPAFEGPHSGGAAQAVDLLPQRKLADRLMGAYWWYLHPLEPVLDRTSFRISYEALYSGGDVEVADERVFMSTLNALFALATQVQETTLSHEREHAGIAFLQRAWVLLQPETTIWKRGSLEIVQCLLLMTRFLQCTNDRRRTWMLAGSAVRMAMGLGLQGPESTIPATSLGQVDALKRQVWLSCVSIDRELSWSLGPTSMIPLTATSSAIDTLYENNERADSSGELAHAAYIAKSLELYEISGYIMLSQIPAGSRFSEALGLPRLGHSADLSVAIQIDGCLRKWERNLPTELKLGAEQVQTSGYSRIERQKVALHLRLLHARSLLFRPMLAHLCLPQLHSLGTQHIVDDQSLGLRVMQECATLCIETSRAIIALVEKHSSQLTGQDTGVPTIRWWHRIFYIYAASQHLIAAMLRPDLFGSAPAEALGGAVALLQKHEHLSPCVGRCVKSFQTQAQKVKSIFGGPAQATTSVPEVEPRPALAGFQGFTFQDLGFEADNWLFGMEDMSWLENGYFGV
ncbi:hypothetical protein VTK73DRAFT_9626 [Phialemonium thermophilum]|uniref:Zn(2)-C6 fungal-type domain-containing protein n=1 Tax=Phialemonium thermophilum TaxID=223376 RepID=A0ABR3XJT1_9PEZI